MRQPSPHSARRPLSPRICGALGLLLFAGLLLAAPASATYEQVATFAGGSRNVQLTNAEGMAVNYSGAGGVPVGTLYAVGRGAVGEANERVVRYGPKGEFREAWGWGVGDEAKEFQRCGPDGEAAFPDCTHKSGVDLVENTGIPGEGIGQLWGPTGIAVDQATGNVYVFNKRRSHGTVQVYSADGTSVGGFGEMARSFNKPFESIATTPGKFHETNNSNIAVDDAGSVYVTDFGFPGDREPEATLATSRIMVFKPQSPGDYEHYEYAGREDDIAASHGTVDYLPAILANDEQGNLYTTYQGGESIYRFAPGEPDAPDCEYKGTNGGAQALTVNPANGEVFYFNYKNRTIRELSPCDAEGKMAQTGSIAPAPKPERMPALAFDPALSYEASRPPGILYGVNPDIGGGIGLGYIFTTPEIHPPEVVSQSVSAVGSSTATLGAQIDPKGSPTDYVFEYETEAQYEANEPADRFAGASEAPPGGTVLGSGQGAISAAIAISGLSPDTAYRFRTVATSHCNPEAPGEPCEDAGEVEAFHTFPVRAPGLPDHRAWELVSPAQKNGGEVFPAEPENTSCKGAGFECKPGTSSRHFPMQSSPDGEAVVYEGFPFSFSEGAVGANQYIARRGGAGWQTTTLSPKQARRGGLAGYDAFSEDLGTGLLYQGNPQLSPEAPAGYPNLYAQPTGTPSSLTALMPLEAPNRSGDQLGLIYAGASTDLSRIFFAADDALTPETPFAPEAQDGGATKYNLYEWAEGQLRLVNVAPGNAEAAPGAKFATINAHAISADGSRAFWSDEAGQVYLREDGESTVEIPDPAEFLTASADGSHILLADGHLFDIEDLQAEPLDLSEGKGGFLGIAGQSDDLTHVYFVDTEVLSGEAENQYGAKAQAGKDNLYAFDEGKTTFIATLAPQDNVTSTGTGDWSPLPSTRSAEASPAGRFLAFISQNELSGYDNTGPCPIDQSHVTGLCPEAFLYDSATGRLSCASCDPSGRRPLGPTHLPLIVDPVPPQPRYLTDSGRLYFDSQDSLSPFDTNNGVEDVYQYEPQGLGTCSREAGCLDLISAGHEPVDSNFLAADPSGKNVFFTSRDQLTLKDHDDAIDLYDAREFGGIASENEVGRGECQGEACQPAISAPNDPTPGSSSFEGAGNVVEGKAKKHKRHKKHAKRHKGHGRAHGRAAKRNRGGAK